MLAAYLSPEKLTFRLILLRDRHKTQTFAEVAKQVCILCLCLMSFAEENVFILTEEHQSGGQR